MCARATGRGRSVGAVLCAISLFAALASGCGSEQRTGTNFCRRLADALPEIGEAMATQGDVLEQVSRYESLLEVAPLTIEADLGTLVDLLRQAADVDTDDPVALQALADAAYAANRASKNVAAWVVDTCAVDIATGLAVTPPRTPTTTVASTVPAPETTTTNATGTPADTTP